VFLVGNFTLVRAALRRLIGSSPGLCAAAEAATPAAALAAIPGAAPDVILLDPDQLGPDAIESIPSLLAAGDQEVRVIVLTGNRDPKLRRRAVQVGAQGIVDKQNPPEMLFRAIEKVHGGELWLERSLMASLLSKQPDPGRDPEAARIASLTPREREVIEVVALGLSNPGIGRRLFISAVTVRHHLSSIFSKLAVKDRFELLVYAYRHGLVQPLHKS
jgi:two-component system, NarL family, nitrate/nitrite response regulator NarL